MMTRPPVCSTIGERLIRVIAPNPSPMTYWGTNTYILTPQKAPQNVPNTTPSKEAGCVVIDVGPNDAAHFERILDALPAQTYISHILITHAHVDHSTGAQAFSARTGAQVYAFGPADSGRSAQMQALAESCDIGGGEGFDAAFSPDITLADGETLDTPAGLITALHTPGHMSNHLCFTWEDLIFSGDLIMGWSSSLISPPDGDAAAFRSSCEILLRRPNAKLMPGHGDPVPDGHARITALLHHRAVREQQILKALETAPNPHTALSLEQITKAVYTDLDPRALPAAARNTFAHLIDLTNRNHVSTKSILSPSARFHRKPQ